MRYKITASRPIPTRDGRGKPAKYPFAKMKIGESFTVSEREKLSARRSAHQFGERHGHTFATRGTRIWRVT